MHFNLGDTAQSKLMNITGVVTGFFRQGYLITDENGYEWALDNKAELIKIEKVVS